MMATGAQEIYTEQQCGGNQFIHAIFFDPVKMIQTFNFRPFYLMNGRMGNSINPDMSSGDPEMKWQSGPTGYSTIYLLRVNLLPTLK